MKRVLGLGVVAVFALVLVACGGDDGSGNDMPGMDMGGTPSGSSSAPYDARFIDSMIAHHEGAIAMAQQALQQSTRPELRSLAEAIVRDQRAEIAQMRDWRSTWYPNLAATGGMGMDMGSMQIAADSAKPFDLRFIDAMIAHHEGAISMAQDAKTKATKQEIRTLADGIITAQQREVAMMRQWKKDWFGL